MARRERQRRRRAQNPGPAPSEPHRANVPGSLEHASGDVDEFEAGIVAGADGIVADEADSDPAPEVADSTAAAGTGLAPGSGRPSAHQPADRVGGSRVVGFLRACWAELQRVQWPDRRQVGQATAVVLGFVVIAGAYLGLADAVAQRVIDYIL